MTIELTAPTIKYIILIVLCLFGWIKTARADNDFAAGLYFMGSLILTLLLCVFIIVDIFL